MLSLRLLPALECPQCGQILVESDRDEKRLVCPECGYYTRRLLACVERKGKLPKKSAVAPANEG